MTKLVAVIGALVGLFAYFAVIATRWVLRGRMVDFDAFYFAAKAMVNHTDPYMDRRPAYLYPPFIAFLYAPLAMLPEQRAAMIVLGASILIVLAALVIVARTCLRRLEAGNSALIVAGTCLLTALVIPDKIKGELAMLQTNSLILLLWVVALNWLDRWPALAGAALGAATNIKYLAIVMLPWLLIRRRWKAAAGMAVGMVGFALLPATLSGWHENLRHLSTSFAGLARMVGVDTPGVAAARVGDIKASFSLSVTSAIARMTDQWHVNAWTVPITGMVAMLVPLTLIAAYRRNGLPVLRWPSAAEQSAQPFRSLVALEWGLLSASVLAFSPQTNSRHLILLLLAIAFMSVMILAPRDGTNRRLPLIGAGVLMLGLTFPWGGTRSAFAHKCWAWYTYGGQGWCILAACGMMLWAGAAYARSLGRAASHCLVSDARR